MENQIFAFEKYIDDTWNNIRILSTPTNLALFGVLEIFEDSFFGAIQPAGIGRLRQTLDKIVPHIILHDRNKYRRNLEAKNLSVFFQIILKKLQKNHCLLLQDTIG